jgi:hypothetical protein
MGLRRLKPLAWSDEPESVSEKKAEYPVMRDLLHGQPVDLSDRCPICHMPVSYQASACPYCTREIDHRYDRVPPPISGIEEGVCVTVLSVLMIGGLALIVIPIALVLFGR